MQRSTTPWIALAIVALGAFLIWVTAEMSRTDRADRIALTIAACGLLVAVAIAVGAAGRRRG